MSSALQALEAKTLPTEQANMDGLIARMMPAIELALPKAIGAERFVRMVFTQLHAKPELYDCEPRTVLGAMMLCAQLGLEPGPLGHAYFVPYKRQCTFILGYKGMIELAGRSGRLRSIIARPVYEGDVFEWSYGITDRMTHRPCTPADRGAELLYYGLARYASPNGSTLHVMYPEEIEAAKQRSQAARAGSGPWVTDPLAQSLKTVIRRMSPWLPMSVQFARGLESDDGPVVLTSEGEVTALDAEM